MKKVFVTITALLVLVSLGAQELSQPGETAQPEDTVLTLQRVWTLRECLDYANENNIQLRQSRITYQSGLEDTQQAKAALFPSLTASTSQSVTYSPFSSATTNTAYSGSYGLNANMTLYSGGKLRLAVKQQEVKNSIDSLSVEKSAMDIRLAIVTAYMQCLYASEAVGVSESTLKTTRAQRDRAEEMWKAGSVSKVDLAQLESQLSSAEYQLTVSKTDLANFRLQLKQLLELGIDEEMELSDMEATEEEVLRLLPSKADVYALALENMPEIASGQLGISQAELALKQAKAGYLPTLGLSAGVGTSNRSGAGNNFINQIQGNLNANAGLTLSIPIFDNRRNKTNVNKAKLTLTNSQLSAQSTQKSVLRNVEDAYLDVVSAQSQYVSAKEKEKYARQSFELTEEQFNLGMKNTVELVTANSDYLNARQALLQSKYMALLNLAVLDIYQGKF